MNRDGQAGRRSLPHTRRQQITDYFCGPATVQMIAEARIGPLAPGQPTLGERMTDEHEGTNRHAVRAALTDYLGREYRIRTLNEGAPLDDAQRGQLLADIRTSVDAGYGVAVSLLVTDPGCRPPWFPALDRDVDHWVAAFGYDLSTESIQLTDPAVWGADGLVAGASSHWIRAAELARFIKTYVH